MNKQTDRMTERKTDMAENITSSAGGNNNCTASSPGTNSTGESFEQK